MGSIQIVSVCICLSIELWRLNPGEERAGKWTWTGVKSEITPFGNGVATVQIYLIMKPHPEV